MQIRRLLALLLSLAMVVSLAACGGKPETPDTDIAEQETAEETVEVGDFDGTYPGKAIGHNADIAVDVVIADGKLSDIVIKESSETHGLGDNAMEIMKEQMIASNSTKADTVAGATVSSAGFLTAVKNAFEDAGISPESLESTEVDFFDLLEDRDDEYTADVVVVGAGGAGMSAAIEAANAGASVIVVEKLFSTGGNTLLSGAEMAAPQNWLQEEQGIEDSPDLMYQDTLTGGDNENDPALVRVLADNALAGAEWLRDEVDVTFEDYMLFFGGHSVERSLVPLNASGVEPVAKMNAKLESLDVPVHTSTKVTELIQDDDGKVVGVKAEYAGQEITYNANNAVIIATGGFGANIDMRTKYNPDMGEKILSTNSVGSQGDGVVMAEDIGAQLVDMEFIQTYPTCDTQTGALLYVGDVRMAGRAILVNKEGERFVEELERRDVISKAVTEQTGEVSYLFWDEASMVDSAVNVKHEDEYNNLIARGQMVKADTIEEAADFFEIDADALKATVERYNEFAEAGEDLDFNKRGELTAFTDGPYYIMMSKPAVHHTMGGIKINPNAQVIDTDGNVIEGLYAAGEVTGDIHGTNRLGSNAIADIVVFGRISGANAAGAEVAASTETPEVEQEETPAEEAVEESATEEDAA